MRILSLLSLLSLCSCGFHLGALKPNNIQTSYSCEWEIQKDMNVKTKPKVLVSTNWEL